MCEKAWSKWHRSDFSESARADSGNEGMAFQTCPDDGFTSEGKPSDVKTNYFLAQLREELSEIRKRIDFSDDGLSLALASVCNLERHLAAQERWSQETAESPEKDRSVERQIAALRESLEDQSPQAIRSSSSKEEEHFLVAPIRGIDEDGRLLLGDRKILSASALKI